MSKELLEGPPLELFGRFTLIDRIAVGGMAEVYLARSSGAEGLDKYFALKRILPHHMKDAEFVQMFKSEAMIAINLTQSNIVQIYEFGQENGQFYLAMEFIEGRDLRQILTRCAEVKDGFTIEQSIFLASEVASGLEFAHKCIDKKTAKPLKIIHRDVSPQNIMINLDGEVKIIDFGIAKAESRLGTTRSGTVKGKISYMSPEQTMAQELDGRTDVFSAGIILWELLTGRRLFEIEDDDMVTINKIRECRIADVRIYNPRIPEEVHRITMKALTKDRSYRYASARDFHRDLLSCLNKINPHFTREDLANLMKRLFQREINEFRQQFENTSSIRIPHKTPPPVTAAPDDFQFSAELSHTHSRSAINVRPSISQNDIIAVVNDKDLKRAGRRPTPKPFDEKPVWDTKDLLASVEVKAHAAKQKLFNDSEAEAKKQLNQMAAPSQTFQDLMIMGMAAIAFVLVASGIYFRDGLKQIVQHPQENVQNLVTTVETNLGVRSTASVQLPGGDTDTNSSSKDATLTHTKIKVFAQPSGSMVELNGQPYGMAPTELLLPMDAHVTVTIKHAGYSPFKQDFNVTGPQSINVVLDKNR